MGGVGFPMHINPCVIQSSIKKDFIIMMNRKISGKILSLSVMLSLAVLLTFGSQALAASGKELYGSKGCVACHGADGKAPLAPNYPKLAGQNAPYMVQQLKDFKANTRLNGMSAMMAPMAATLSDADMQAIADYLSKVK